MALVVAAYGVVTPIVVVAYDARTIRVAEADVLIINAEEAELTKSFVRNN